nr:transmembrane protein 181-like [Drosophila suzukii]
MCFYGLLNFYLYTMAYVYSPDGRFAQAELAVTKDNPAISMIGRFRRGRSLRLRRGVASPSHRCGRRSWKNDYDSD